MSRIFLSHSSLDTREAVALKRWLAEQDPPLANEIFLDVDPGSGLQTGTRWKDALRRANARCEAVICLLSPNWEASQECRVEYRTAENLNKQIFMARLEPSTGDELTSEWQRCDLFGEGQKTNVDIDGGPPVEFATHGLYRLRDGIRGAGIGAESFVWPPPGDSGRAPYRGWEPLQETDAAVFFGRDAQIVKALDALRGMRLSGINALFVVLGPSGTGKSSFLRAGVLPRLRREDRRFVLLDIVRPERNVLTGDSGLAQAITRTRSSFGLSHPSLGEVKTACTQGDADAVAGWLAEIRDEAAARLVHRGADEHGAATAPTLVLPLDQAEELFSVDSGETATVFLHLLAGLVERLNTTEIGLAVAATIRTDRYEMLQTHPELADVGTLLFDELKPMPPTQFKEVITGPGRRATEAGRPLTIAPDLVDRLLADAAEGADTLPMLALTMSRLYTDYGSTGELTLAQYESMGGMRRVVQTEIDDVLSSDPQRRAGELEALRAAFIPWLATINPDNDQPMRRVARWSDLPDASRPLIDALVGKRLMVKDTRGGETVVEVALESLLRQWDELAAWLREQRGELKDADDLERSAAGWAENAEDQAWLLSGTRLVDAENLANRPGFRQRLSGTSAFLAASRHAENQRRAAEEQQRLAQLRAAEERAAHAQERQVTAESHAATLRKRSRILRVVLAMTAVVAVIAAAGFIFATKASNEAQRRFEQATSVRLTGEGVAMMVGNRPGGDIRAMQELMAARTLTSTPDDDALYSIAVKDRNTRKVIPTPVAMWAVAYSPDGKHIAGAGRDGFIRIWDAASGEPVGEPLEGQSGLVQAVVYSPDGTLLATAAADDTVRIWDADSGDQIRELGGHAPQATDAAFSTDGRRLATLSSGGLLRVWEVGSGRVLRSIDTGHTASANCVAFAPDGRLLATGSDDGSVRMWDAATGAPVGESILPDVGFVGTLEFSPDGRHLVSGGSDAVLLDTATRQPVGERITGHTNTISSIAFSRDGRWMATASADATIRMWDAETGVWNGIGMWGHESTVLGVAFSPDGNNIVSAGRDATVRIWEPVKGAALYAHADKARAVAYAPDGKILASAGYDGNIQFWNPETGQTIGDPITGPGWESLAFSRDGKKLAAGGFGGTVVVFDTASRKQIAQTSTGHSAAIRFVEISPDATRVSLVDWDGVAGVWDLAGGKQVGTEIADINALALTADWKLLAESQNADSGRIRLLNLNDEDPKLTDLMEGHTNKLRSLSFDPSGEVLASAGDDTTIRLWDVASQKQIGDPLTGHTDSVFAVAFSPDGSRLISGGGDTSVRLWDVQTHRQLGDPLLGHGEQVISVAWRPDGDGFASASNDGTVYLWPASAEPSDICSKLTQNMSPKQWNEWVSPDIDYKKGCPDLPIAPD